MSVALFSSTSCFSRDKGMWPVSILPQAGGEEGGKAEGWRQPRVLTLTERHCLAQKVKGVYFPSRAGSSCPVKSDGGAGPTSQSQPSVPSSLGLHPASRALLFAFTDDFHTAWCALPPPQPCSPGHRRTSFRPPLKYELFLEAPPCWIILQCSPWLRLLPPPNLESTGLQPTVYGPL